MYSNFILFLHIFRNKDVFEDILHNMKKKYPDLELTWQQIRTKIKSLKQDYKKAKKAHDISGTGRTRFRYFDEMNEILGDRPATYPKHSMDTSSSTIREDESSSDEANAEDGASAVSESERSYNSPPGSPPGSPARMSTPSNETRSVMENPTPSTSNTSDTSDVPNAPLNTEKERQTPAHSGTERPSQPTPSTSVTSGTQNSTRNNTDKQKQSSGNQKRKGSKRKQDKADFTEISKMFLSMEDAAAKRQLEAEERWRKQDMEMEERRRKENQEFQLQMMKLQTDLFKSIMSPPSVTAADTNVMDRSGPATSQSVRPAMAQHSLTILPPVNPRPGPASQPMRSALDVAQQSVSPFSSVHQGISSGLVVNSTNQAVSSAMPTQFMDQMGQESRVSAEFGESMRMLLDNEHLYPNP